MLIFHLPQTHRTNKMWESYLEKTNINTWYCQVTVSCKQVYSPHYFPFYVIIKLCRYQCAYSLMHMHALRKDYRRHDSNYSSRHLTTANIPVNSYWPFPAQPFLVSGPVVNHDHIFALSRLLRVLKCGLPFNKKRVGLLLITPLLTGSDCWLSLTREPSLQSSSVQSSKLLLVLARTVILGSESCGTRWPINPTCTPYRALGKLQIWRGPNDEEKNPCPC
jgi:hypothetical protein